MLEYMIDRRITRLCNYIQVGFYHVIGAKDHHLYDLPEALKDVIREQGSVKIKCVMCSKTINADFFGVWD